MTFRHVVSVQLSSQASASLLSASHLTRAGTPFCLTLSTCSHFTSPRYGTGVYSYTNSARADAHATSCTTSPYRIILMCSTLVRKKKSGSPQASTFTKSVSGVLVPYHTAAHLDIGPCRSLTEIQLLSQTPMRSFQRTLFCTPSELVDGFSFE